MSVHYNIQDSLISSGLQDSIRQTGDLRDTLLQPDGAGAHIIRDVPPEEIFGHTAHRVNAIAAGPPAQDGTTEQPALSAQGGFSEHGTAPGKFTEYAEVPARSIFGEEPLFQAAVIALLAIYAYIILRHLSETGQFLRLIFVRRKEGRSQDDSQNVLLPFANAMTVVFCLGTGIAAARAVRLFDAEGLGELLPAWAITAGSSAFLAMLVLFQFPLLKAMGSLTFSEELTGKLLWQKRIFMVDFAILATPAIVLAGLADSAAATVFGFVVLAAALFMLLWFARKTFGLFMNQKISILFWILYLCTFELMPVGIAVLAVFRNIAS